MFLRGLLPQVDEHVAAKAGKRRVGGWIAMILSTACYRLLRSCCPCLSGQLSSDRQLCTACRLWGWVTMHRLIVSFSKPTPIRLCDLDRLVLCDLGNSINIAVQTSDEDHNCEGSASRQLKTGYDEAVRLHTQTSQCRVL